MNINDLAVDYPCLKPLSARLGECSFYPPQESAFKSGFLEGRNLLLASPTSSGKTLVAEVAMMVNKSRGGKSLYLVPLKSLANEKFNDFSKLFNGLLSVGLSTGDLTRGDERLGFNDLIISSYEKFDSLLRHRASWIKDVSLVIVDEAHLIDDVSRGPIIEVLLTRLRAMGVWVIALSATIGNPESVGSWLDALVVRSDFRPVKLIEGVLHEGVVSFKNDSLVRRASSIAELCVDCLKNKKQSLVFVNSRRSAESVAEKLSADLSEYSVIDSLSLNELSSKLLRVLPSPTAQCKRLAECVKHGVAFNHAGLASEQKRLVEDSFRSGLIKVISCTTVLAYGVSLPAYMVILRDLKRFDEGEGMSFIPVSEYLQVAGRAGRSGYDSLGESVIIIGSKSENDLVWNNYLCAKPGELVSKLGVEPVLRFHALSLVCDGSCNSVQSLADFFASTFFGKEYGSRDFLFNRVEVVVNDLVDWGLINVVNSRLVPSRLGSRVNELYIDPLSAWKIIQGLNRLVLNPLGFLQLACSCGEINNLRLRRDDYQFILEEIAFNEDKLMQGPINPFSYDYDLFIRSFKTALVVNQWIGECGEDKILDEHGVPPGTLHQLLSNLEWVLYSIGELGAVQGVSGVREFTEGLITRVKYGVKSELLSLVSLRGIGRVRARKLYVNGFTSVSDLRKSSVSKLSSILGPSVARSLIDSLEE